MPTLDVDDAAGLLVQDAEDDDDDGDLDDDEDDDGEDDDDDFPRLDGRTDRPRHNPTAHSLLA